MSARRWFTGPVRETGTAEELKVIDEVIDEVGSSRVPV
jgi:hypothetical protein